MVQLLDNHKKETADGPFRGVRIVLLAACGIMWTRKQSVKKGFFPEYQLSG